MLLPLKLLAGYDISGTVLDASTKQPIVGAVVFVNNSLKFALSDSLGKFEFTNIQDSISEVVASANGYQPLSYLAESGKPALALRFDLAPLLANTVSTDTKVTPELQEKFLSQFLGLSENAYDSYILNPNVLHYNLNAATGILTVSANSMLHIINEGLGYNIHYQLVNFQLNTNSDIAQLEGFCFFQPLNSKNTTLINKWEARRKITYAGSCMHFMRSYFNNALDADGFTLQAVKRVLEDEPDFKEASRSKKDIVRQGTLNDNGVEKKFVDVATKEKMSMAKLNPRSLGAGKQFSPASKFLLVKYQRKEDFAFLESLLLMPLPKERVSLLNVAADGITVLQNGDYYDKGNISMAGSMQEKVAELLPYEYRPL